MELQLALSCTSPASAAARAPWSSLFIILHRTHQTLSLSLRVPHWVCLAPLSMSSVPLLFCLAWYVQAFMKGFLHPFWGEGGPPDGQIKARICRDRQYHPQQETSVEREGGTGRYLNLGTGEKPFGRGTKCFKKKPLGVGTGPLFILVRYMLSLIVWAASHITFDHLAHSIHRRTCNHTCLNIKSALSVNLWTLNYNLPP